LFAEFEDDIDPQLGKIVYLHTYVYRYHARTHTHTNTHMYT